MVSCKAALGTVTAFPHCHSTDLLESVTTPGLLMTVWNACKIATVQQRIVARDRPETTAVPGSADK